MSSRDIHDNLAMMVRLSCGHVVVKASNIGLPHPDFSTWCHECSAEAHAMYEVFSARAKTVA